MFFNYAVYDHILLLRICSRLHAVTPWQVALSHAAGELRSLRLLTPPAFCSATAQGEGFPITELGRGRGGSRGCCRESRGCRSSGTQNGSSPRSCPNCRHGTRGTSRMTVQLDLSHLRRSRRTNLYTTPIHSHAYHKNPSRYIHDILLSVLLFPV